MFRLADIYDGLIESLKALDNVQYTEVRSDIEKYLASDNNRVYGNNLKGQKEPVDGPFDQVATVYSSSSNDTELFISY